MSTIDVMQYFVEPMKVIFGDPPGEKPEEAIMVYVRPLSHRSPEVLTRTADHFLTTAKRRTWPMPAEVIAKAAEFANLETALAQRRMAEPGAGTRALFGERLLRSDLGMKAADEGWVVGLYEFGERHLREPTENEIANLKQAAAAFDRSYARLENGEEFVGYASVRRLAGAMKARREHFTRMVRNWAATREVA